MTTDPLATFANNLPALPLGVLVEMLAAIYSDLSRRQRIGDMTEEHDLAMLELTLEQLLQERNLWRQLALATDRQLLSMIWELKSKGSDEPVPAKRLERIELIAKLREVPSMMALDEQISELLKMKHWTDEKLVKSHVTGAGLGLDPVHDEMLRRGLITMTLTDKAQQVWKKINEVAE